MSPALNREAVTRHIHGNRRPVTDALICCVKAAQGNTGQSRVVALGLLSACDGDRFPFPIDDLGTLGESLCRDLFEVWHLRHRGHEPHKFLRDGDALFEQLARRWDFESVSQETEAA